MYLLLIIKNLFIYKYVIYVIYVIMLLEDEKFIDKFGLIFVLYLISLKIEKHLIIYIYDNLE